MCQYYNHQVDTPVLVPHAHVIRCGYLSFHTIDAHYRTFRSSPLHFLSIFVRNSGGLYPFLSLKLVDAYVGFQDTVQSKHLAVQDFSHVRATPSPHWTVLPEEDRLADATWPVFLSELKGEPPRSHDDRLDALLPQTMTVMIDPI